MAGRGRRASLPPVGFAAPTGLDPGGLVITAKSPDGSEEERYDLSGLPGTSDLRHEIAIVVARLCGADGKWRSPRTLRANKHHVSALVHWLDAERPGMRTLADLRPADWDKWVVHVAPGLAWGNYLRITATRGVLLAGHLQEGTRTRVQRRTARPQEQGGTASYEPEEFAAIARAALRMVHAAETRIGGNHRLLLARLNGQDVRERDAALASAVARVWADEALTTDDHRALGTWTKKSQAQTGRARQALFLTAEETWACAVLLVCDNGWNASVVDRLKVPTTGAGAGEDFSIYTIGLVKPRRGPRRHSSSNLVEQDEAGPGRTMRRVLTATAPARQMLSEQGQKADALLIHLKRRHNCRDENAFSIGLPAPSALRSSWLGEGLPPVTLQRLRQTHQTQVRKAPSQNSRDVHEDVYVRRDEIAVRESQKVAVQGLQNALEAARDTVLLRVVQDSDADEHIRDGSADTPVAACQNVLANPRTGTVCADSFLLCLACPNAVATPRHLPRLVTLHAALEELASALPKDVWQFRWQEHYLRLCSLLELHSTPAERAAARADATAIEKDNIDRLLRGEFS